MLVLNLCLRPIQVLPNCQRHLQTLGLPLSWGLRPHPLILPVHTRPFLPVIHPDKQRGGRLKAEDWRPDLRV